MTTSLDTALVPVVVELLNEFGATVTYTRKTSKTYSPTTGSVSTVTSPETVKIIPPSVYSEALTGRGNIELGDMRTGVAASGLGFVPANGDKLAFNSDTFTVVAVSPVATGDEIALYELQLRK